MSEAGTRADGEPEDSKARSIRDLERLAVLEPELPDHRQLGVTQERQTKPIAAPMPARSLGLVLADRYDLYPMSGQLAAHGIEAAQLRLAERTPLTSKELEKRTPAREIGAVELAPFRRECAEGREPVADPDPDVLGRDPAIRLEDAGYADTTTDLVAERAGVSVGTLYQYYPNKDVLLVALFEQHLEEIEGRFRELEPFFAERAPIERLATEMASRMFAVHATHPRLHRILIEEAPLPPRLLESYAQLELPLRARFVEYLGATVPDPELVALMVINLLEAMAHRYTLYPPQGRETEQLERATVAMVVAYVESSQPAASPG